MTPESRQRLLIRATLVAGMLLAGLGLVAVLKGRKPDAPVEPPLSRTSLRVRVVDGQGRTVKGAEVFVKTKGGAKPAQARWSPKDGVLMLPKRARAHDLRVTARGYRLKDVASVGADRTITLERGHLLRVKLRDVPSSGLPKRMRIMLRIHPLIEDEDDPDRLDAKALIDLMDNLGGAGPREISRSFGYPVSVAHATKGILVPSAGRYHVRWGLFDLKARTWFSLDKGSGRDVDVRGATTDASLVVSLDLLQATLDGLKARIARAEDAKSK